MAVYYKFKSARDYDSIPMDGPFISVGVLKERIFESKHLGRGTDFDLVVTNAQTNEEYLDEAMLIPKNTSVLIRRVPGRPRLPIVTEQDPKVENNKVELTEPGKNNIPGTEPSTMKYSEESEWDEFGNDLYSNPEVLPTRLSNPLPDAQPTNKADEDSKIKALIDTPALDWQRQGSDGFGPGRGFGRGMAGRTGGRGFGLERKTPPQGYVCHRCKVPGHFIQHCPTNGDPNFDIKRVKPPTGIPKSMLMATPDGSYALPSGAVAVLKPNEAAFEKEIEGLPSTRSIGDLPPELHCPLCKEVMKDAVLTSKCCFKSFCDNCIRNYIISKSMCVCEARNILADDLLPNKTLRDTINRILEFGNNSAENDESSFQVPDMESARCPPPRFPSPTTSAASRGEHQKAASAVQETLAVKEVVEEGQAVSGLKSAIEKVQTAKTVIDASEATHESSSMKEAALHGSAPVVEEEVQQKLVSGELGKKKKKKKARVLVNDLQWKGPQDQLAENYMMPMGPSGFSPYWTGMQPGRDGFMGPYASSMPYMGYGLSPLDMPFGALVPQDPFGAQSFMLPSVPPYRDFTGFGMGMNIPPPAMSREEFEARKADLRRKRENGRRSESREFSREWEHGREASSSVDVSSMKSKSKPISHSLSSSGDHHHRHHQSERLSPEQAAHDIEPPPRQSKRKSNHYHEHEREREHEQSRDWEHDLDYDHYEKDQERDRDLRRHHHHHSESYSKPLLETAPKPTSTTTASVAAAVGAAAAADKKQKASVFSRISFPEEERTNKKSKVSSATEAAGACGSSTHQNKASSIMSANCGGSGVKKSKTSATGDYESNDDERHFKRKPLRYESSPPTATDCKEELPRHSRGSRDRDREHEYERHGKHR
ncbi:E3 ubiquitin ligase PQT3-like isoform X3 [Carica papaya]|uniref:E3 ubiquitin ligase PQT3-like isoform X3 n=1 Tax=Carica papaya TaxID=3649 RepID=UPI000B8C8530|nr:E3 ubiquitin ligase PQT3-like isoform X3 [Carica papaya]